MNATAEPPKFFHLKKTHIHMYTYVVKKGRGGQRREKKSEEGRRGRGSGKSEGGEGEVGTLTHDMVCRFERRLIVGAMYCLILYHPVRTETERIRKNVKRST